jgi:hypothetical protein
MLRAVLIATSLALSSSSFAQQVRVISGDIEHVYGRGGEVLDDADLQARNQRARERMQAEQQLAIQRLKLQQAALAYGPNYSDTSMLDPYGGGWVGGGFFGPTRGFFHRGLIRPRIGISHRIGGTQDGRLATLTPANCKSV